MPKPECAIEQFNRDNKLGLLSIRGPVLVLNTHVLFSPNFTEALSIPGQDLSLNNVQCIFQNMCVRCGLCKPSFSFQKDSQSPRIERDRLGSELNMEAPETKTFDLQPKCEPKGSTICIIDDEDYAAESSAIVLSGLGYHTIGIAPGRRETAATKLEMSAFVEEILQHLPNIIISDKGLGWIDGIELIDLIRLKNDQVVTVMLTGEPGTRETHRKAHLNFEKPFDLDVIAEQALNYHFEEN